MESSDYSSGDRPPSSSSPNKASSNNNNKKKKPSKKPRRPYARKLPPSPSEQAAAHRKRERHAAYRKLRATSLQKTNAPPSVWSFDSLFMAPVLDGESVREDLYGSQVRAEEVRARQSELKEEAERRARNQRLAGMRNAPSGRSEEKEREKAVDNIEAAAGEGLEPTHDTLTDTGATSNQAAASQQQQQQSTDPPVDKKLTRLVEDRIYGLQRSPDGSGLRYSNSLLDSSRAVQFRDGVRLGKALPLNVDRICHFAKKELQRQRPEEAQEYYLQAIATDPTDGRPYLGLSRIAQRRGDLVQARCLLKEGIAKSSGGYVTVRGPKKKGKKNASEEEEPLGEKIGTIPDLGPNPFLLQVR